MELLFHCHKTMWYAKGGERERKKRATRAWKWKRNNASSLPSPYAIYECLLTSAYELVNVARLHVNYAFALDCLVRCDAHTSGTKVRFTCTLHSHIVASHPLARSPVHNKTTLRLSILEASQATAHWHMFMHIVSLRILMATKEAHEAHTETVHIFLDACNRIEMLLTLIIIGVDNNNNNLFVLFSVDIFKCVRFF